MIRVNSRKPHEPLKRHFVIFRNTTLSYAPGRIESAEFYNSGLDGYLKVSICFYLRCGNLCRMRSLGSCCCPEI